MTLDDLIASAPLYGVSKSEAKSCWVVTIKILATESLGLS